MEVFELRNMPPVLINVYWDKKQFSEDLEGLGIVPLLRKSDAQTVSVETEEGMVSLVLVSMEGASVRELAVLCHEAVHVAGAYMEGIGEDEPRGEFLAYIVQQVAQYLMEEHLEHLGLPAEG